MQNQYRRLLLSAIVAAELALSWPSVAAAQASTEFDIPTTVTSNPFTITADPDGALRFTERFANKIGRIDTMGNITEFALPIIESSPVGITVGLDGALSFAQGGFNRIGRIDTLGNITEFVLPIPLADLISSHLVRPARCGSRREPAIGFGRITTAGVITVDLMDAIIAAIRGGRRVL